MPTLSLKVNNSWTNILSYDNNTTSLIKPLAVGSGGTGNKSLVGNPSLMRSMFDNNLTSGTLCFPVFTGGWADGGYMNNSQLVSYLGIARTYNTRLTDDLKGNYVFYQSLGPLVTVYSGATINASRTWKTIGTLPSGFRPIMDIGGSPYSRSDGNNVSYYWIGANGQVQYMSYEGAGTQLRSVVTYLR